MKQTMPIAIPAPEWLVRRMETLRRMPPPTSAEVKRQMQASAEARKRLTGKPAC